MKSTYNMPRYAFVPGRVFRAARIIASLTQAELGQLIGRDRRSISRIETKGARLVPHTNTTPALIVRTLESHGVMLDRLERSIRW